MVQPNTELIERVREASRRLVRELGFMEDTLAGTSMSASAVHALIEVGSRRVTTARELAVTLRLEKSTVSRLLKTMIENGYIAERRDEADGRLKHLELTEKGDLTFAEISRTASDRVATALLALDESGFDHVVRGLEHYADALERSAGSKLDAAAASDVCVLRGYTAGIVGRTVSMHAAYYGRTVGFGLPFEAKVGREMSEFLIRLDNPLNAIWAAMRAGRIVGTVSIDGEDLGDGIAHLRWFIVGDGQRGMGIGAKLIEAAMDFVDEAGFQETQLWTFKGLDAARRLYERVGFELVEEMPGARWGETVQEQRFVRRP